MSRAAHLLDAVSVQRRPRAKRRHRAREKFGRVLPVLLRQRATLRLHPSTQPFVRRLLVPGHDVHEFQTRALVVRAEESSAVGVNLWTRASASEGVVDGVALKRGDLVVGELVIDEEGGDGALLLLHGLEVGVELGGLADERAAALAAVVEGGGDALAALQEALELAVHHRERLLRLAGGVQNSRLMFRPFCSMIVRRPARREGGGGGEGGMRVSGRCRARGDGRGAGRGRL